MKFVEVTTCSNCARKEEKLYNFLGICEAMIGSLFSTVSHCRVGAVSKNPQATIKIKTKKEFNTFRIISSQIEINYNFCYSHEN